MLRGLAGWMVAVAMTALAACGGAVGTNSQGSAAVNSSASENENEVPSYPVCRAVLKATFSNGQVSITFDRWTGRILQVEDLRRDPPLRLLDTTLDTSQAPVLELEQVVKKQLFPGYEVELIELPDQTPVITQSDDRLVLRWNFPAPLPEVEAEWRFAPDAPELLAYVRVYLRDDDRMVYRVRYPVVAGLAPLAGDDPTGDQFLTTKEGGLLIFDPLSRLPEDNPNASALNEQHYLDGHETMAQMMAYLHPGVGGLLLYTPDPAFNGKWFSLCDRAAAGRGEPVIASLEVTHGSPDVRDEAGAGVFAPPYPVVLRWLDRGDWTDAAEVYRRWSDRQVWAADPIAQRDPAEREFFTRTGASIFGLSAREDQRAWIEAFHDDLVGEIEQAKLLYVLGWDFHPMGDPEGETFTAWHQAGWDERFWSPLMGASAENIAQAQEQGDWAMPFLYDLQVHSGYPGWDGFNPTAGAELEPGAPWLEHVEVGPDAQPGGFVYWNPHFSGLAFTLCLADPATVDFFRWRDTLLVGLTQPALDGLYFDLGFAVANHSCYDHLVGFEHQHPSGSGGYLIEGGRAALDFPIGTANPRGFRYGGENIGEPYVDLVDYWHLGDAGAGPFRGRVMDDVGQPTRFSDLNRWIMEGTGIEVPLMAYLDHHNGAIRTGGKLQISYDIGEAFYWVIGAEYLWGGVAELIYFNTGVDWPPGIDPAATPCEGQTPCAFQASWGAGYDMPRGWTYGDDVRLADPDKIAYLREAIYLRVASPAAPYLTMGRMEAPPALDPAPPKVGYDYDYYSALAGPKVYHSGIWNAASVIVMAWRHPYQNAVALLLANTSGETISTNLVIDLGLYGMTAAELRRVSLHASGESLPPPRRMATLNPSREPVTLSPREFAMYELTPTD